MNVHDVVRLRVDVPDTGLKAGSIGAIVAVFNVPQRAFEVEFVDKEGHTIAQVTLRPDDIELVDLI